METTTENQELVETIAYAVDIMRDAMERVEVRQGKSELYYALVEGALKVEQAKLIAMAKARRLAA